MTATPHPQPNTITAAEYVALDRKPIAIYTYRESSALAGRQVRIGNAATIPPEWVVGKSSIALITEAGYKVYVRPDAVLTIDAARPPTAAGSGR